ncbi:hypothetical protein GPUN_2036 [Glaciecola punicea ACAM 611]|uniref:Probable beta-carotene 15,15'-dioxygenase n=1 Tax=Glaciecola punicea ACAM 611 TaxID=1121923 RepID=H5TCX4_9ALTE|nr:Brp/Blh family beta-carotene 15,15'-dioxygenase [Glaciecola punicea]OFA30391.1 hypothetical protein BAE46_11640 [Glaciecola punicea]GAB56151.1 hypothetical protein GPUN_2036 [Glaciecola punicea ACAM 611]
MTKLRYTQIYIGTLLIFALLVAANFSLPEQYLIIGLAAAVTILGLPHGALDFAVAKSLNLVHSVKSGIFFISAYTTIAVLSILFWLGFPASALVLFLCVSIFHFSADWRTSMPKYAGMCLAAIVICGPAVIYSDVVTSLFTALLLSVDAANLVMQGMRLLFFATLAVFLYFLAKLVMSRKAKGKWRLAEWICLIMSSLVLTPLLHFSLYFCLLHSPKHLHDVSAKLNIDISRAVLLSIPFVLATMFIALGVYYGVSQYRGGLSINTVILRWVFIGLFGLTMSHMILISVWHRHEKAA